MDAPREVSIEVLDITIAGGQMMGVVLGNLSGGHLVVRRSSIVQNLNGGAAVQRPNALLEIEDTLVMDNLPDPVSGKMGVGLFAQEAGQLIVVGGQISGNAAAGLLVQGDGTAAELFEEWGPYMVRPGLQEAIFAARMKE